MDAGFLVVGGVILVGGFFVEVVLDGGEAEGDFELLDFLEA